MKYNLKNKIEVTEEFLNELIAKNWQEVETLQQQIANIDTSTRLGVAVAKLLKNASTNYYVIIGCLEALAENPNTEFEVQTQKTELETTENITEPEVAIDDKTATDEHEALQVNDQESNADFEPFEYFVDFDEPSGEPLSDKDIYG